MGGRSTTGSRIVVGAPKCYTMLRQSHQRQLKRLRRPPVNDLRVGGAFERDMEVHTMP